MSLSTNTLTLGSSQMTVFNLENSPHQNIKANIKIYFAKNLGI
jgi:hypothetical protein